MSSYLSILTLFLVFFSTPVFGQWQTGWALDPHAGINSALLQPAATAAIPYDWDVNLVQVHGFFDNDYAFIGNASGLKILRSFSQDQPLEVNEREFVWQVGNAEYAYNYLGDGSPHFGYGGLDVMGPAISLQLGATTRVGFFTRIRGMASARDIDADFSYFPYSATPNGSIIAVEELYAAAALWSEAGLHVSQALELGGDAEIRLGGNLRMLTAVDGISIYNPAGSLYGKISLDSISVAGTDLELGFTNGLRGTSDEGSSAGQGVAGDFGIQLAWNSLDQGGYKFTAGLSLLDVGRIQFSQTAEVHRFATETPVVLFAEDYEFFDGQEDVDAVLSTLSESFYGTGNGNASRVGDEFSIGLPTTVSAQFSYRPTTDLQFSAAYLGDMLNGPKSFSQGEQLTFAGHFSRWWYGAGFAVSAYNWDTVNLGVQIRLGPVVLGSDRLLGSVMSTSQLRGGDFYIGLKIHDFSASKNRKKSGKNQFGGRGRKSREVKCYTF